MKGMTANGIRGEEMVRRVTKSEAGFRWIRKITSGQVGRVQIYWESLTTLRRIEDGTGRRVRDGGEDLSASRLFSNPIDRPSDLFRSRIFRRVPHSRFPLSERRCAHTRPLYSVHTSLSVFASGTSTLSILSC